MLAVDEFMPQDAELDAAFFRSDEWAVLRDSGRITRKRALKDALRAYLTRTYPWLGKPEEQVERERYVGRVEFLIRSRWGKKGAKTKARNKRVRKRRLTALAERAQKKCREAQAPMLFSDLPVQHRPANPGGR